MRSKTSYIYLKKLTLNYRFLSSDPPYSLQMMKIMRLRTGQKRQMVTTMRVQRGHDRHHEPQPRGRHVAAAQQHAHERRQQIAQHMLQRMAVHGRHRHRGRPLVVLLVHPAVQAAAVQRPMRIVEANLLDANAGGDLQPGLGGARQWPDVAEAAGAEQPVGEQGHRHADSELVEEHGANDATQPGGVDRLVGARLGFVAAHPVRPAGEVGERVQAANQPVDGDGDDGGADHPQVERIVACMHKFGRGG